MTPKLRDTNGVVLKMESVGQDDMGVYVCVAENFINNYTRRASATMELGKLFRHRKFVFKNKKYVQEKNSTSENIQ